MIQKILTSVGRLTRPISQTIACRQKTLSLARCDRLPTQMVVCQQLLDFFLTLIIVSLSDLLSNQVHLCYCQEETTTPWRSLVVVNEGWISPSKICCVYVKTEKFMQHMHGMILYLFDCWADPVVHLLLLKSSMTKPSGNNIGIRIRIMCHQ